MGVTEINERGVVHDGVEYPLDVLIYATGFQWMATSTFNMITGRGGRTLREKWQTEGTRTFLGLHSHGFPNLFIMTGPQGGGGSFNFTDAIDAHSDYVVWMLDRRCDSAASTSSTSRKAAEDEYAEHCRVADIATAPLRDCLSYYNGHGDAPPAASPTTAAPPGSATAPTPRSRSPPTSSGRSPPPPTERGSRQQSGVSLSA